MNSDEILATIIAAEIKCNQAEREWKDAAASAKAAKEVFEGACAELRAKVRGARQPSDMPLLTVAESSDSLSEDGDTMGVETDDVTDVEDDRAMRSSQRLPRHERLQAAADAGVDTWEEYRGER